MKDLLSKIEEIEQWTLQRFKDNQNPNFNFVIYYFAPDDYHSYLGFQAVIDPVQQTRSYICHQGNFYVDSKKMELFIDNPTDTCCVPDIVFNFIYNRYRNTSVWGISASTYALLRGKDSFPNTEVHS